MKKIFSISILILFCATAISGFLYIKAMKSKIADKVIYKPEKLAAEAKIISKSEVELRLAMKKLWESRATLLRGYIINAMNDSKDLDEARDKLLKNAGDLGASIRPYHGYLAGGILAGFLKKDVLLTGKVIKAAKIGNKKDLDWARKKWYENAFLLAGFFASTRNQTMKYLTEMLYKHLDLTMGEIEAIFKKDEVKDLDYYEQDRAHMLMFSDVLVNGLVKQFPKKFKE